MVTNTASHVAHPESAKENRLAMHVTTELENQEKARFPGRQILKWFGILSTLLIGAAAVAPNAFGIPVGVRPWVFLASIFWCFAICTGMFTP